MPREYLQVHAVLYGFSVSDILLTGKCDSYVDTAWLGNVLVRHFDSTKLFCDFASHLSFTMVDRFYNYDGGPQRAFFIVLLSSYHILLCMLNI